MMGLAAKGESGLDEGKSGFDKGEGAPGRRSGGDRGSEAAHVGGEMQMGVAELDIELHLLDTFWGHGGKNGGVVDVNVGSSSHSVGSYARDEEAVAASLSSGQGEP